MMEILNAELANALQNYTFPLELTGFVLAAIEIRFPHVAGTLVLWARSEAAAVKTVKFFGAWRLKDIKHGMETSAIYRVFFVLFLMLLWAAVIVTGSLPNLSDDQLGGVKAVTYQFLVGGTVLLFLFTLLWLAMTRLIEGREVGTLGLAIASAGLLGEAYQFAVLRFG